MPFSVVVPAHNEERVIGRCLEALLAGAAPGEIEVVVACNGCTDGTAAAARAFGPAVRVVETATASKIAALNLGDEAAAHFPRIYLDADVVLTLEDARRVAAALGRGPALAAAPEMEMDLAASSAPVRAYYRVWTRLPYTRDGMIGVGSYAVSAAGRRRFDRFPDVIADDGFVRMSFAKEERLLVRGARARITAPRTLGDLVKIKTRSRLGRFELAERYPELSARERAEKSYGGATGVVAARPWLWPAALVYLWVNAVSRGRARRQIRRRSSYVWERDESSRR